MDRTPDLSGPASGLLGSRRAELLAVGGALGLACLLLAGCGGGAVDGPQVVGAEQEDEGGFPVVVHVVVEASCPRLESDVFDASLLYVDGDRARVRSDCTQDGFDSVFTFDARLPASSTVRLSPSDLRGVTVDAARASAAGEVTLRYEPRDGGFRPVATSYGDGEDEPVKRSR